MFKQGDLVVVKGLDMAFVFECYIEGLAKLYLEGETREGMHHIIHARPEVLLPNNTETCIAEGWIQKK